MKLADLARFLALAAVALPGAVLAQDPPVVDYAVVSIIGDRFTVADRNTDVRREGHKGHEFALGGASLDGAALAAVKDVLAERIPGSNVSLALVREPAVFEAEEEVLGLTRDTQPLVDALQPVLSRIKARRIVLVSKTREPVDVHFDNVYTERPGMVEGLGFYLDPGRRVQDTTTFEIVSGYIGVFANFRVSVIDHGTARLIDEERVSVVEAVRDVRKEPWASLTAGQKVAMMKDIVTRRIRTAIPALIERSR